MVFTIHEHTALMTEALCRAASSQFVDPAFIKKLTEVKEQCAAIARDNGAPVKTEEDAQAWVQDVLCKAYTARTLMRKLKGWKVQ